MHPSDMRIPRFRQPVMVPRSGVAVLTVVHFTKDEEVGPQGELLAAGIDALPKCGLPPAWRAPFAMLAHVDARDVAGGRRGCVSLILGFEGGGFEVGGGVEGFVAPVSVICWAEG